MTSRGDPGPAAVALYRPLLDSVPDALILVGQTGAILLANAQADEMFGYERGQLTGLSVDELVPRRLRGQHGAHRQGFFAAPKLRPMGARGQLYGLRKDGTEFAIAINLAPVQTESGLVVSAAIRDVSEQRALEDELKRKNEELEQQYSRILEASRLKSEFLANMSHELRTPLNAIIGFSEILHDGKAGAMSPMQHEFTGDILNSARHLLQLINDVLDLAKVEAGKMEFLPQRFQLPKLVSEVCDVVRTLLARKRLRLVIDVAPGVDEVVLDGGKLKQVLYNYLSNAIKFTAEEGAITVRAAPEPDQAWFRLEVEDTGIGIRSEDQSRLFVEFQQLDEGLAKKHGGTGLGLALTRRIVEAQGGRVGVDSAPGRGSTFYAVLPRHARSSGFVTVELPALPRRTDAPVVLVVEDDPKDRSQVEAALIAAGYAVQSAATGREAIERCRGREFAAITLDLLLPDMNGWEVLRAVREGPNAATPVVVVSIVADRAAAAAFAVQDYIVKPLASGEVARALQRSGVAAAPGQTVLVVESDARVAAELRARLEGDGYRTLHAATPAEALTLLGSAPDAAVVDLQVQGGGLALLSRMRRATDRKNLPIILSVPRVLQRADLERIQRDSLAVVAKGHSAGEAVVRELQHMLASSPARH
jgi:PAS domain S-box-containing protein